MLKHKGSIFTCKITVASWYLKSGRRNECAFLKGSAREGQMGESNPMSLLVSTQWAVILAFIGALGKSELCWLKCRSLGGKLAQQLRVLPAL